MLQLLVQCTSAVSCSPREMGCVFNHPAVMISLIWAFALLIGIGGVLFYLHKRNKLKKEMAQDDHGHELDLKEMEYDQEKYWHFQKLLKHDFKKELEARVQELTKERDELSQKLKDEKENVGETLKKERLQAEHDFYEKILSQIYSTDNNQPNK